MTLRYEQKQPSAAVTKAEAAAAPQGSLVFARPDSAATHGCAHLKANLPGGPSPAAAGREAAETALSAPAAWTGPRAGWRPAGKKRRKKWNMWSKKGEVVSVLDDESSACSTPCVFCALNTRYSRYLSLTLLMRLSLMCRSCCCASCMCRRFWRTSPFPSMALCKASTHHCKNKAEQQQEKRPRKSMLIKAHADAGGLTCCAFPRVRRAVVRGGLRNGRLV